MEIDVNISLEYFRSRMCTNMDIDPATAQIGWKNNDAPIRAPARQLMTEEDLRKAFADLLKLQSGPRRRKEVIMIINHIVSHTQVLFIAFKFWLSSVPLQNP